MPFKVRCKCVGFAGDVEHFPCHFNYQIGEEFTYNGERFEGRICQGLFRTIIPIIHITMYSGNRHHERILFRYSVPIMKDPSMKKYDGVGFRPLKGPPPGVDTNKLLYFSGKKPGQATELITKGGYGVPCHDCKTSAFFVCEPVGLADGGDSIPYYRREINILEKIKNEPGITVDEILKNFSQWEREEIYPPLTHINVSLMLDELAEVDYIEIKEGKAYPKNPPV
jgi:uncharacterized repeat protein (TIGR04076 family)